MRDSPDAHMSATPGKTLPIGPFLGPATLQCRLACASVFRRIVLCMSCYNIVYNC